MLYLIKYVFEAIGKQMKYEYQKCEFSIVLLMLDYKKCVLKASGKLLFNLSSYFYNTKNVCLKKAKFIKPLL